MTDPKVTAEVEKVARAICSRALCRHFNTTPDDPWVTSRVPHRWKEHVPDAIAAIEALDAHRAMLSASLTPGVR